MKIEVDLKTIETDEWGSTVETMVLDALRDEINRQIKASVKSQKALIQAKAAAILKQAEQEFKAAHNAELAKQIGELFKKELMK